MDPENVRRKYAKFMTETMDFESMEEIVYSSLLEEYRKLTPTQMKDMIIQFHGEDWYHMNFSEISKES